MSAFGGKADIGRTGRYFRLTFIDLDQIQGRRARIIVVINGLVIYERELSNDLTRVTSI
jgi:hypothetical protein